MTKNYTKNHAMSAHKMLDNALESRFDDLLVSLIENDVSYAEFDRILDNGFSTEVNLELCKAFGVPINAESNAISLKTKEDIFSQTFCIVDIETTGFSPQKNDIIEIGAIKYQNGKILGRFESFAHSTDIPPIITEITGISDEDIFNAPNIRYVLEKFKIFLQDSVFMAHNADFDFNFINAKLAQNSLPMMKNRTLCTLNLARKTLKAEKYGLGFLNEFLEINYPVRHRAYADCVIALKVFERSLLELCESGICNTEDLIAFSTKKGTKSKLEK